MKVNQWVSFGLPSISKKWNLVWFTRICPIEKTSLLWEVCIFTCYFRMNISYFKLCWQSLWNQSCFTRFHTAVLVLLFSPGNTKLQSFWLLCFLKKQDKTQLWEDQIICKVWRTLGICKTVCSLKDYFVDWREVPSLLWH